MKVTDMVRKVIDARSFETPQWGLIQLKWVDLAGLDQEKKEKAKHRLGELVWRETVTIEVDGRKIEPGTEAEVTIGKMNVNDQMRKFISEIR